MEWRIAGAYFEACNCEAICPCSELVDVVASPIELTDGPPHELRVGEAVRLLATRPVENQPQVACGIPGYDRGGTELYADELAVDDEPFAWEFSGRCAFAGDFDYASA
jgi:hypothetical protein